MSAKGKSPLTSSTVQSQPARRDEGGVLVTGTNLNGYTLAPPPKKPRESWIWKHGEPLIRKSDLSLVWLCTTCHNDSVHHPIKEYILPTASTTPAQRHMERHGFELKGVPVHRGQKRRAGSLLEYDDRQPVMLLDWIDIGWIGSGWILDGLDQCGGPYWMDWIDLRKSSWIQ